MRKSLPAVCLLAASVLVPAIGPQAQAASLNFFNNWFVTGNYVSAGVGLQSSAGAGSIQISGAPCTSGIGPAAAFVPCTTAGALPATPVAAFLYWQTVETAASPVGGVGKFNGYDVTGQLKGSDTASACWIPGRANQVLRAYRADVLRFLPIDPATGVRRINGAHTVALGSGVSGVLTTQGASLVIIYRTVVPGAPTIAPLTAVSIYDGQVTVSKAQRSLDQDVAGFYQSAATMQARVTHIVGNGQSSFNTVLRINHDNQGSHAFTGGSGADWDNLTLNVTLAANANTFNTSVDAQNNATCLNWSAIVGSTPVVDTDGDGLLDTWEANGLHRNTQSTPATFGGCKDFPTESCVDLKSMGAVNGVKDIFMQMDWMHGTSGGGGVDGLGTHSHVPKLEALNMVASSFAAHGIKVHFDVGSKYQGLGLSHIIPYKLTAGKPVLAQGGSDMDENSLRCVTAPCAYIEPYPVISFKLGFNSIRDGNHLAGIPAHFSQDRKDAFHYVLFAHALAGPFGSDGKPLTLDPKTTSGIGDRPGGDILVTHGLWRSVIPANDQVGSALTQAGTLMHELGHNLDLSHGGLNTKPNCAPNYLSVMSYLYQTRGLTDASGVAQIDFSDGGSGPLNENSVSSNVVLGPLKYRLRYYAPYNSAINTIGQASSLHCDGSPITDGGIAIRSEADGLTVPDWSNKLYPPGTVFAFDQNFDGVSGQTLSDQPDWKSLNLQQISSRTNFGSLSNGSLATDVGSLATDVGSLATDVGSLATDVGSLATDVGSLATDVGSLATDVGSLATDVGDEDYDTHVRASTDRIPSPQQCAGCGLKAANSLAAITLSWVPPDTGGSLTYNIYRCAGASCIPGVVPFVTGLTFTDPAAAAAPTFTDTVNDLVHAGASCLATATCYNTYYTYKVAAVSTAHIESPFSNAATSEVPHLFVFADNKTAVYGNAIPNPTFQIYGDVSGSLNAGLVTCSYVGTVRNAATYPITCTGPAVTSPVNGVTYDAATYLTYTRGTLTITPRPITVTATANTKVYDGTTASIAKPTITLGSLAYSDTVNWTETFDNRNVGTGKTLTPAGTVVDGNSGNNYTVTFVNATGSITKLPINVTAKADTKVYDGTTTSTAVPSFTLATGDTATFTQTFDNRNAGTGKTLTPAGTISDGNGGNNYVVTFVVSIAGVINRRPVSVTAAGDSKVYDGNTASSGVPTITLGSLASPDTVTWTQTFDNRNAGTGKTLTPAGTVSDGNGGNNYLLTFITNTSGVIDRRPVSVAAAGDSKVYDGNTTSSGVPTITLGSLAPGDTVTWTQTFDNRNAGTGKTLTPAGTISDGNGGNNYLVTIVVNTGGVISRRPISVTAAVDTKVYDGTTASSGVPTLTLGSLAPGDTVTWTQMFDNRNAGTGKTLTAAGMVSDGNAGNNYTVTFVNGTGSITRLPISVTAAADTKVYDGNTTSSGVPTITLASLAPGDTVTWTQTFDNRNAGTGKTLTAAGTVSDGNGGNNYAVTFVNGTGSITKLPISVTAAADTKGYDGTTASTGVPTITLGSLAPDDTVTWTQTFDNRNAGTGKTLTAAGTVSDGNGGNNYTVTFVNGTGNISKLAISVTAAADTKGYDGTRASSGVPALTLGSLLPGDTVTWTQTFDNRNAGSGKTLTAAGTVSDGNGGNNYTVTFMNATGGITRLPISVTAAANTKVYDGTAVSSGVPTLTLGSLAPGDTVTWTQTFDNRNWGAGKTLTPAGTVSDGNGGNNYTVTFVNATGNISKLAISVTAAADTKGYDGTTASSGMPTLTLGSLAPGDTATWTQTFDSRNWGNGRTLTPAGTVSDGNGGNNYTVTFIANTGGSITQRVLTITATAADKVADGNTTASVTLTDDRVTGDILTVSYTSANFADANPGSGKTVTVTGISIAGTDAANYALASTTATAMANITAP